MSYNLPDGVTDADIDRAMGDDPTPKQDAMLARVEAVQNVCANTIKRLVDDCIADRLMLSGDTLACVLEIVAEDLNHRIADEIEELDEAGYRDLSAYPHKHKEFLSAENERLADSFRPKRLDAAAVIRDALRPVPMNPATLIATGQLGGEQ